MHIECTTCGHREEVNKHLVLKIIGAAFANEIAAWVSKEYHCPNCGQRTWKVIQ